MKGKLLGLLVIVLGFLLLLVVALFLLGRQQRESFSYVTMAQSPVAGFVLESPAFAAGQAIPARYTCQGEDLSPPLTWSAPPTGTRSLALIMDDPDAPLGVWVHWVVYNIPPDMRSLPADFRPAADSSIRLAGNSWGKRAYGGPCPPSGTHRYVFQLYALDTVLEQEIADKAGLLKAMEGHVLAYAELIGTYRQER